MKRILVIGELNVDLIVSGLPTLPVLGRELLCDDFQMALGSSSAICASWLAALGAAVDFWGKVGRDPYGEFVVGELERRTIGTGGIIHDPGIRTGVTVSLTYSNDRAMLTYLGSIAVLRLDDMDLSLLSRYDHLHSASIFLQRGLRPGLPALYQAAKEAGLTTPWTAAGTRRSSGGVTSSIYFPTWTFSCPTRSKPSISPGRALSRRLPQG